MIFVYILVILIICLVIFVVLNSSKNTKPSSIIMKERILKDTKNSKVLNIPARRMWGWGAYANNEVGYCGETAVQQSLIYYGNYVSQAQVNKAAGGSFLPGINSTQAYRRLQVLYDDCDVSDWKELFEYIKKQFDNNYPIVAGLYVLEDGDQDYDHVCVMYGYETNDKGELTKFIYNDAYQLMPVSMDCTLNKKGFPKCWVTRDEFNTPSDSASASLLPCSLPNVTGKKNPDGSLITEILSSIQGNVDPLGELLPVLLIMGNPYEANWGSEDQVGAPAIPINCIVKISSLIKGQKYSLLRFDNPDDLPVQGDFLKYATWTLRIDFVPDSDTYSLKVENTIDYPFMSNGTYFFRCVINTDPQNMVNSVYNKGTNRTDTSPDFQAPPEPEPDNFTYSYQDKSRKLKKLKPRKKLKQKNYSKKEINYSSKDGSMFGDECKSQVLTNNNGVICTKSEDFEKYLGNIATYWNWHFPPPFPGWTKASQKGFLKGAPNPGCVQLMFTPTERASDEYPCCMKFTISTVKDSDGSIFSPTNSLTDPDMGLDNDGFIGLDGRMYIGCDELQVFMAFSLNPVNSDGSYTMVSADGVTVSTLVPVQKPN